MRRILPFAACLLFATLPARAVTLRISAAALERALRRQVFTSAGADSKPSRHYLRGNPQQPCSVYADEPHIAFLHIPDADGESIGFREARIHNAINNAELNTLLEPFLAHRLPAEMTVNAANLMRTLLVRAPDATGYNLTLLTLNLHSMSVQDQSLLVDLDADIRVD